MQAGAQVSFDTSFGVFHVGRWRRLTSVDVLAVSVGNEVPGDIVRVHGIGAVEDVLSELVAHVHDADPDVLRALRRADDE